ncbi:hypothetical protein SAMN05660299_01992 [Megasphaera paucivorans]|uniref:Uncharacterized protein n=1 Tax=Megasphaera paucivorans TaxID=349095 RepID=A0A1G9Y595_9FIRM|nr:hypothetical protein SAMN05660299_01992 [Megasphaera paucivorans]
MQSTIYRKILLFMLTVGISSIAYYLSLSEKNIWIYSGKTVINRDEAWT